MTFKVLIASATLALAATVADATLIYTDADGNVVANPNGSGTDAVTFTEAVDGSGGRYTITNNVDDSELRGVGVTNPNAFTFAGYDGSCFDFSTPGAGHCYDARTITESQWDTIELSFDGSGGLTGSDIWGSFETVMGDDYNNGNGVIHWYDGGEVGLRGGQTEDGFNFINGALASNLLGFLTGSNNPTTYFRTGTTTTPDPDPNVVPLPAAGWMLLAGLGGIAAMRRKNS